MSFSCYIYRLPFELPLETSQTVFNHRKGFILVHEADNRLFYSETAPLPGFSKENFDQIKKILASQKDSFLQILNSHKAVYDLQHLYETKKIPASLEFGLDLLAYQLQAHRKSTDLPNFLFPNCQTKIPVNAVISLATTDVIKEIPNKIAAGYSTIKCKIGFNFDREYHALKQIHTQFPDLTIRVDANRAWTLKEAKQHCPKLADLKIEYCEEPLREVSPENYKTLSENTELPIALDETVSEYSKWQNLLPYSSYLIIKPMVIGSIEKNFETKRLANTHDNKVVVTTALESGIGRYFTAILASGIGSAQMAHGLSTGSLFKENIFSDDLFITDGYFDTDKNIPSIDFSRHSIFERLF